MAYLKCVFATDLYTILTIIFPLLSYIQTTQTTSQSIRARRRQVKVVNRVHTRVNLERVEATRHGRPVGSRVRAEDTQVTHGAAESQGKADLDQERVERAEDGVQAHLVIHTNLAMAEDIQMEEDTIVDIMDMEVILAAQEVGHPAANLARAAEAHLGHLAVNQARVVAVQAGLAVGRVARAVVTHLLLTQAHGIHQETHTPNLLTVVVRKMMGTGTLVDMEVNGTRDRPLEAGHLVASRGRAEEVAHHRAAGVHLLRVNLASLDTEI